MYPTSREKELTMLGDELPGTTKRPTIAPEKRGDPDRTGLVGLAPSLVMKGESPWKRMPFAEYWSLIAVPSGSSLKVIRAAPPRASCAWTRGAGGACRSGLLEED